jgi:hypothetical protein
MEELKTKLDKLKGLYKIRIPLDCDSHSLFLQLDDFPYIQFNREKKLHEILPVPVENYPFEYLPPNSVHEPEKLFFSIIYDNLEKSEPWYFIHGDTLHILQEFIWFGLKEEVKK